MAWSVVRLLLGALVVAPTPSTDGGVAMSVAGVDCAPAAAGERCRVTVRLVNISDGAPVFVESDQTAYDAAGRAFHPDPAADAVANGGRPVTRRLPREAPVSSVLVFDLPAGDRIDHVVLHGEPGTPGQVFPVS
jgi:hypothetical protein